MLPVKLLEVLLSWRSSVRLVPCSGSWLLLCSQAFVSALGINLWLALVCSGPSFSQEILFAVASVSIWLWQFYDSRLTLHAFVLEQLGQTEYYNLRKEPEPPEKTSVFIVVFYDKVQINKKQQPLLKLKTNFPCWTATAKKCPWLY